MMNLLINEFKKLCGRKQFILLSVVLLFVQVFTLYAYERNTEEFYYLYENRADYEQSSESEEAADYYRQLAASRETYCEEYTVFLNEMLERADKIRSGGLLKNSDSYLLRELDKTVADYENLQGICLSDDAYTAVGKYSAYLPGLIFEILFVLLMFYFGFYEDKEKGYYSLLRSTGRGRGRLASAKVGAFFFTAAIYTILQEAATLGVLFYLYGTGDLSAPIQSAALFRDTSLRITVLDMIVLCVLYKILALWVTETMFYMLGTIFSRIVWPTVILGSAMGTEFLLWRVIKITGRLRVFHYVNLFSLFTPYESIGAYANFNICGFPVGKNIFSTVIFILMIVLFTILGIFFFSVRHQIKREGLSEKIMFRIRTKLHVLQEGRWLPALELYKTLIQQKKLLILLLAGYYSFTLIQNAILPVTFSRSEDASYEYYAEKLQGEYTGRQADIIEDEKAWIESMRSEMLEYMSSEEGDQEMNQLMAENLRQQISLYSEGLGRAEQQITLLDMETEEENSSSGAYFVNISRYKRFLLRQKNHLAEWLIAVAAVIILCAGLHAADEKNGMSRLIYSTVNGRARLGNVRLELTLMMSAAVFLMIAVPDFIRLYRIDQLRCFKASFSDFVTENYPDTISIGTAYILTSFVRLLSLTGFGTASLYLSKKLKNEMTTVLILLGAAIAIVVFGYILSADAMTLVLAVSGIRVV